MAVDCQNIYKNARKSAGFTQEKAAQLLSVSVDSLRDYEQSQRPVPSDVASAMCDVYQAPYLAVQHLRRSSELGKRVVPEIQLKDLPEAVLSVLAAVQRFIVKRDAMIEIVADGKIEEDEQAEWNEIMDRMNNLFVAMAICVFRKEGVGRERIVLYRRERSAGNCRMQQIQSLSVYPADEQRAGSKGSAYVSGQSAPAVCVRAVRHYGGSG